MRLMQRLAISGLLSVILIVLLTGTLVTRRDMANIVERGVAPEERSEQQLNPAWVQNNVIPGQDEPKLVDTERRVDFKHKQSEPSAVGPPPVPEPGPYIIKSPNPPLDDVTNQRREKIKEMMKHGWDNYVRYAWGKNELRPISKKGHSASIFGASNMGATIVDGLDTLYIMGLHDEFKQGRDWIAENLDFDIVSTLFSYHFSRKISNTLELFRHMLMALLMMNDILEILVTIMIVGYHLVIIFLTNYIGQLVIDSSQDVFFQSYNSAWYCIPLSAQKLLLFVMMRSAVTFELNFSGLFVPGYKGFSRMMSTCFSFVTTIYSTYN
ncbi:Mannosyl-oligosaccharide 1,2-alpha-mannosidase IB, partial [Anthophora quadrimaculata]